MPNSELFLFIDYFGYLTSAQLIKNKILLLINMSFFLSIIGISVPLIYILEICEKYNIHRPQSVYVLCLIGIMTGIGRVLSTIVYKVNHSNAKNRIFAYELTLIFSAITVCVSVFLCDTLFSFAMFAITFGVLVGFNLNLRSLLIYDVVGLEWSDDSLFFNVIMFQALGVLIGIPVSGKFAHFCLGLI
jgi:hypothetical protein